MESGQSLTRHTHSTFVHSKDGIMASILQQAEKFAVKKAPVLITGETGTGKEYMAKLIHAMSEVRGPIVSVNCSAIPPDLLENELFGHEKGAYTGAVDATEGYAGRARNGTLFLDEIGEMPIFGQVKLLRLIQDGEYEKIGSQKPFKTNARFIFATNRNLQLLMDQGLFRRDLYYRISTFELELPPIRKRGSDIPMLIEHFVWIAKTRLRLEKLSVDEDAGNLMLQYSWPGNIREMQNVILRAAALSRDGTIRMEHLPESINAADGFAEKLDKLRRLENKKDMLEAELIRDALKIAEGNKSRAAELLQITRNVLRNKMNVYGIDG